MGLPCCHSKRSDIVEELVTYKWPLIEGSESLFQSSLPMKVEDIRVYNVGLMESHNSSPRLCF